MQRYDENNAKCVVLTFKEGLLSPVAHDLRLLVQRFRIEVADGAVTGSFDTASLIVDCPMKDGVENPTALSAADKAKIAAQIREEVLASARFPQATFRSSSCAQRADGGYDVTGELTLHGVSRQLSARSELVDGAQRLELTLHQPDFGITPFRAMLGTLKIQADVRVVITTA